MSALAKDRLAQEWPVEEPGPQMEVSMKGETLAAGKRGVSAVEASTLAPHSFIPSPVPGFSATFFHQSHRLNSHRPINGLAHIIDRQ